MAKKLFIGIPDQDMDIQLGNTIVNALSKHFLHSESSFQFYDVASKNLFFGDLSASLVSAEPAAEQVTDFNAHLPAMICFYKRYVTSNKACRFWADILRTLDIESIVPQHGRPFVAMAMVN